MKCPEHLSPPGEQAVIEGAEVVYPKKKRGKDQVFDIVGVRLVVYIPTQNNAEGEAVMAQFAEVCGFYDRPTVHVGRIAPKRRPNLRKKAKVKRAKDK